MTPDNFRKPSNLLSEVAKRTSDEDEETDTLNNEDGSQVVKWKPSVLLRARVVSLVELANAIVYEKE